MSQPFRTEKIRPPKVEASNRDTITKTMILVMLVGIYLYGTKRDFIY